ncbi:hypothetical protein chiPu_0006142 [Chiloscyllium punctatum]|uniref:Uncharacterized protein n=1 Tax=Chiloscyllium punctatum TaxID=137246 RepID=A0A401SBF5_CHIPU|nr:hypothetical protein [Chiloscyllium punctatum]
MTFTLTQRKQLRKLSITGEIVNGRRQSGTRVRTVGPSLPHPHPLQHTGASADIKTRAGLCWNKYMPWWSSMESQTVDDDAVDV